MRSNEIKMAYYGILMKDGSELTHYGVKGMKWGKHIFGKKRTAFGEPDRSSGMLTWKNGSAPDYNAQYSPEEKYELFDKYGASSVNLKPSSGRTARAYAKATGDKHNMGDDTHFRTGSSLNSEANPYPRGTANIHERQENDSWGSKGRTVRATGHETSQKKKRESTK